MQRIRKNKIRRFEIHFESKSVAYLDYWFFTSNLTKMTMFTAIAKTVSICSIINWTSYLSVIVAILFAVKLFSFSKFWVLFQKIKNNIKVGCTDFLKKVGHVTITELNPFHNNHANPARMLWLVLFVKTSLFD